MFPPGLKMHASYFLKWYCQYLFKWGYLQPESPRVFIILVNQMIVIARERLRYDVTTCLLRQRETC